VVLEEAVLAVEVVLETGVAPDGLLEEAEVLEVVMAVVALDGPQEVAVEVEVVVEAVVEVAGLLEAVVAAEAEVAAVDIKEVVASPVPSLPAAGVTEVVVERAVESPVTEGPSPPRSK